MRTIDYNADFHCTIQMDQLLRHWLFLVTWCMVQSPPNASSSLGFLRSVHSFLSRYFALAHRLSILTAFHPVLAHILFTFRPLSHCSFSCYSHYSPASLALGMSCLLFSPLWTPPDSSGCSLFDAHNTNLPPNGAIMLIVAILYPHINPVQRPRRSPDGCLSKVLRLFQSNQGTDLASRGLDQLFLLASDTNHILLQRLVPAS